MTTTLYRSDRHECLAFTDLVPGEDGVQANQFLIIDDGETALLDPGGTLTYTPLSMEIGKRVSIKGLRYVIASHQDPDIIASLDKWLLYSEANIVSSTLWARFLPHLVPNYLNEPGLGQSLAERCVCVPDGGMTLPLGQAEIKLVPAHFLHSVGNFHVYDPTSRILFSGDVGASMDEADPTSPVTDFDAHEPGMRAFHQRYMVSNKACRLWVNMVRQLDVAMIVPQHGQPFCDAGIIEQFLTWFENLQCGVDLMCQTDYAVS